MTDDDYRTYLKLSIIDGLRQYCKLSNADISKVIDNTDLLEFIDDCYFTMHQQGVRANVLMVKEYLKNIGYTI
ncbi:MAG: DUF3791 domain-containing protein [Lachnospiraceae bacterium]|nr:DUF3791 domain-containing protein [Lachnospiraceae bacterium]